MEQDKNMADKEQQDKQINNNASVKGERAGRVIVRKFMQKLRHPRSNHTLLTQKKTKLVTRLVQGMNKFDCTGDCTVGVIVRECTPHL